MVRECCMIQRNSHFFRCFGHLTAVPWCRLAGERTARRLPLQQRQPVAKETASTTEDGDIHERFLRDLEPQLAELKEVSLALGNALDTQNAQLDRLDTKVDVVNHNMKRVSIDAKKLTGRRFPVCFRFRCAFMETRSRKFLRDADGEPLLE